MHPALSKGLLPAEEVGLALQPRSYHPKSAVDLYVTMSPDVGTAVSLRMDGTVLSRQSHELKPQWHLSSTSDSCVALGERLCCSDQASLCSCAK